MTIKTQGGELRPQTIYDLMRAAALCRGRKDRKPAVRKLAALAKDVGRRKV